MTPLEKVNSMKMPFAELKGVTFTEADRDRVVARMLVRPDLCTLGPYDSRRRDDGICGFGRRGGDRDQSAGGCQGHHHDREQDQFHRRREGGNGR